MVNHATHWPTNFGCEWREFDLVRFHQTFIYSNDKEKPLNCANGKIVEEKESNMRQYWNGANLPYELNANLLIIRRDNWAVQIVSVVVFEFHT